MKNFIHRIAESLSLLLLVVALSVSGNAMAQTNNKVNDNRTLPPGIVKVHGAYPASGTLVQALSSLRNDSGYITTITTGSAVRFTACKQIILSSGFRAINGARFVADIKPYSPTDNIQNLASSNKLNKYISISPNPFSNSFIVSINAAGDGKVQLAMYNSVGIKVKEQSGINLLKGANTITVNAEDIASGAYLLEVDFGDSKIVSRIIKNK